MTEIEWTVVTSHVSGLATERGPVVRWLEANGVSEACPGEGVWEIAFSDGIGVATKLE